MALRVRLLAFTFCSASLLLFALCLGAQNLKERHSLNLGFANSSPLPTGFLVGVSMVIGVLSGGATAAVIIPTDRL